MSKLRVQILTAGLLMFILGWVTSAFSIIRVWRDEPLVLCQNNLRSIYLTNRKLPMDKRDDISAMANKLNTSFLITKKDSEYLNPLSEIHVTQYVGPMLESLLCREDPAYGAKIGLVMAETTDFKPSYQWRPDSKTLAYCPFHKLACTLKGNVESR